MWRLKVMFAAISLVVGGIGIMDITLASVTERTREIGIRRAIGARQRQVVGQFLIGTVVLATVGGLIGVVFGLVVPTCITYFFAMATVVTLYSLILSVGISMCVGIVFSLYPAFRAAKLDPSRPCATNELVLFRASPAAPGYRRAGSSCRRPADGYDAAARVDTMSARRPNRRPVTRWVLSKNPGA